MTDDLADAQLALRRTGSVALMMFGHSNSFLISSCADLIRASTFFVQTMDCRVFRRKDGVRAFARQ